jgi:hypothetical protein
VRQAARWLAGGLAAAALAACASTPPPSASPSAASPVGPSTSPAASSSSAAASSPASGGPVVDPSLLDILPGDVDGVPIAYSPEASEGTAAGGGVPEAVEALAYGLAVSGEDLVVASVVRLVDGAFGEAFYRDWRTTYAEGVCEPAGGVAPGTAEAELGGRNVFIGSCVNGGHTYVTWLEDRAVIVSAYAVGDRRFGERLMESLEE